MFNRNFKLNQFDSYINIIIIQHNILINIKFKIIVKKLFYNIKI